MILDYLFCSLLQNPNRWCIRESGQKREKPAEAKHEIWAFDNR